MEIKEAAVDYSKRRYTIAEYLELENAALEKHVYYQVEIFAMAGAKPAHNVIAGNIFACLWNALRGKPCQPYNSDTRIHIPQNTLFTYPDVSILCSEPEVLNNDEASVMNPVVIFEVLSPSTRSYDRGGKFKLYKQIPTLTEYILADSGSLLIEAWHKDKTGVWAMKKYTQAGGMLDVPAIDVALPIADIYSRTKLMGNMP